MGQPIRGFESLSSRHNSGITGTESTSRKLRLSVLSDVVERQLALLLASVRPAFLRAELEAMIDDLADVGRRVIGNVDAVNILQKLAEALVERLVDVAIPPNACSMSSASHMTIASVPSGVS